MSMNIIQNDYALIWHHSTDDYNNFTVKKIYSEGKEEAFNDFKKKLVDGSQKFLRSPMKQSDITIDNFLHKIYYHRHGCGSMYVIEAIFTKEKDRDINMYVVEISDDAVDTYTPTKDEDTPTKITWCVNERDNKLNAEYKIMEVKYD